MYVLYRAFLIIAMRHRLVKSPEGKLFAPPISFPWLSGQFLPTENPHTPMDSSQTMAAIPRKTWSQEDENEKEIITMSSKNSNKLNIPQARAAMDKFKMEAASEVDV